MLESLHISVKQQNIQKKGKRTASNLQRIDEKRWDVTDRIKTSDSVGSMRQIYQRQLCGRGQRGDIPTCVEHFIGYAQSWTKLKRITYTDICLFYYYCICIYRLSNLISLSPFVKSNVSSSRARALCIFALNKLGSLDTTYSFILLFKALLC